MRDGDWRELERETKYETPYMRVNREVIATPTRPAGVEWTVVRRRQAAIVAPRTPDGRFYLVRQERIPIRQLIWEFPAGQVDGAIDEAAILATAHRELAEETGCRAEGEMISLGIYYSSAGFTDEKCHLFLATDVVPRPEGHAHDDGESIVECRAFTVGELKEMIARSEIIDANTLSTFARLVVNGYL